MNRNDLTKKLNELLQGESAYYNATLCDFINKHLSDLGIDNTQGDYYTRYDNYTFTIMWKQRRLVSFEAKRKRDETHNWVVKEVVVEDDFIDYETSRQRIKQLYKKDIEDFNTRWNAFNLDLGILKDTLRVIRTHAKTMSKEEQKRLIRDLEHDYWLVDEALESEE